MPGHSESGSAQGLRVESSDQFVVGLSPALEVGGRINLKHGMSIRPYAYAGVSVLSTDEWKSKARLLNAPNGVGSFTTVLPTDNVVGRVGLGLHLMKVGGIELSAQYDGEFGSKGNSHSGGVKLRIPF